MFENFPETSNWFGFHVAMELLNMLKRKENGQERELLKETCLKYLEAMKVK
eukprot:c5523_g1_i2 orf=1-150(-)